MKRDYACPKCKRHYRLELSPEYYCNCKQKEKRAFPWPPELREFERQRKGIRAIKNPIATGNAFFTPLQLLPQLDSVFGIERSR